MNQVVEAWLDGYIAGTISSPIEGATLELARRRLAGITALMDAREAAGEEHIPAKLSKVIDAIRAAQEAESRP